MKRGCSSIGRVYALQAWGTGIETPHLQFLLCVDSSFYLSSSILACYSTARTLTSENILHLSYQTQDGRTGILVEVLAAVR